MRARTLRSRLLAGYGTVRPRRRPEDWSAVRDQVERAVAHEVVAGVTDVWDAAFDRIEGASRTEPAE